MRPQYRNFFFAVLTLITLLGAVEWWLGKNLFNHSSYSNSDAINLQLLERNVDKPWDLIFLGDSEVRWGVDPREIDAAFQRAGKNVKSFNHAFDGFGAAWWHRIYPTLANDEPLSQVKYVAIGIQLTDSYSVLKLPSDNCGSLQRPVLMSPLGIDHGWTRLCEKASWDSDLAQHIFGHLRVVRYASAVRSMILPHSLFAPNRISFNSAKTGIAYRGFEAHRSISENPSAYAQDLIRWKAQYNPDRDFRPLAPSIWPQLTSQDGFFDQLADAIRKKGQEPVFFALPTNPTAIDIFKRREDYSRNSKLLSDWASRHHVVYVDLGIRDIPDLDTQYSDMRHLSEQGAKVFSKQLGDALALKIATKK